MLQYYSVFQLPELMLQKIRSRIDKLLGVMYTGMESGIDQADHSIYTGVTGTVITEEHQTAWPLTIKKTISR